MKNITCPCCGKTDINVFFEILNAPIFSLITVNSKEEAINIPRRDIALGFCEYCGFIFNTKFDKTIDYFSAGYEDQQGFSKTFMQFLTELSMETIEKYDLNGKNCLEIGCGKGDFINLLSELTKGKGIGIDPCYEDGRQNNSKLTFLKEFYSLEHGLLDFDFVCSRHTLEHIYEAGQFIKLLYDSLDKKKDVLVLFEIPQVKRILDIQAFWDVYYEHCSYFSAGSLSRLFKKCGFEILDLRLVYDEQYVVIEATRSSENDIVINKKFPVEESVLELKESVFQFKENVQKQLSYWKEILSKFKIEKKKVVIWGGGSKAVGFLTNFAELELFEFAVDINPHMQGNYIPGIGIQYVQPIFLKKYKPDAVFIMNGIYKNEIEKTLNNMGLFPIIYAL